MWRSRYLRASAVKSEIVRKGEAADGERMQIGVYE